MAKKYYGGADAKDFLGQIWAQGYKNFNPYANRTICESRVIDNPAYKPITAKEEKQPFYVDWNGTNEKNWVVHALIMLTRGFGTFMYGQHEGKHIIYCDGIENYWKPLEAIINSIQHGIVYGGALLRYTLTNGKGEIVIGGIGKDLRHIRQSDADSFHSNIAYLLKMAFPELSVKIDREMKF